MTVSTACSSSLVAVALACQSLLTHQSDMALAGAVCIEVPQLQGYLFQEGGIMSPDGVCRAFDAQAQGTVGGNGVAVVVLKRLEDAMAAGDNIIAVIRGYAINNDGAHRVGFTAPSIKGQAEVICEALATAGVSAETVTYVEAHGTGTSLGDPIEIEALTQAFRSFTQKKQYCAVGSVKTNIGHLDTVAGVAGLIKAALSVQHGVIPASLHYQRANPRIDFASSPFFVNDKLREWRCEGPRRAGVSSFGIGGTNAHVVLEEAPTRAASSQSRALQILPLSARTPTALEQAALRLADHLEKEPVNLADAAYTLAVGRKGFAHRMAVVCGDRAEALERLRTPGAHGEVARAHYKGGYRAVALLFGGQGSQRVGMGVEIYQQEKVFRGAVDEASAYLKPLLEGIDLREVMYEGPDTLLRQTWVTQPALYVLQWALLKQWESWGVRAEAMLGHSLGEVVAATSAGVLEEQDALKLIAVRGRLMWQTEPGAMLSVLVSEEQAQSYVQPGISIAAVNGHQQVVYTGRESAIAELQRKLEEQGIAAKRLEVERAFHSETLEPIRAEFLSEVGKLKLRSPQRRFVSNVTGKWAGEEVSQAQYWWHQMRQPVLFAAGVRELSKEQEWLWLDMSPGAVLGRMVRTQLPEAVITSSLRAAHSAAGDRHQIAQALGTVWAEGVAVDWERYYNQEQRHRVPLPTYPFERRRHWVGETNNQSEAATTSSTSDSSIAATPTQPDLRASSCERSVQAEAVVSEVWKDVLGIDRVGTTDNFFELGGHSLLAIHMAQQLRKHRLVVSLERFLAEPTITGLVRALVHEPRCDGPAALTPMRTGGTRPPFFAVHPIGGGCFIFRDLVQRLGPDQPFYGLQARELAEIAEQGDPYSSLEEMAANYIEAIRTVQPAGPYLLGGLSWGGVLAFEMAQQLSDVDEEVSLLALLDTPSPEQLGKLDALDDVTILVGLARDLGFQRGIELPITVGRLQGLSRTEQLMRVVNELKDVGVLPAEIPVSWMGRQLQGYRSRLRLVRNYTPRVYKGRLTFFRAAALDQEAIRHLDVVGFDYSNLVLGWDRLASKPTEVHTVSGNHSEILFEPNVKMLASYLATSITRSLRYKDETNDEELTPSPAAI